MQDKTMKKGVALLWLLIAHERSRCFLAAFSSNSQGDGVAKHFEKVSIFCYLNKGKSGRCSLTMLEAKIVNYRLRPPM